MAFPWVFEGTFGPGDNSEWDSETDGATPKQLDIVHYTELARYPWPTAAPFSGAHCMRLQLVGQTGDAILIEGDLNISATATAWGRFPIWFSPDFTGTANDTFTLFEWLAGSTVEVAVGARIVAATNVINLGIGETVPTSFSGEAIERGVWYTVEVKSVNDLGANNGTIDLYVTRDGSKPNDDLAATQVGSLDQGAVTTGSLGIQNHAATTTGTILIDNFIQDDARVYPAKRFPDEVVLTKSGHAFVGPGTVENITLMSGAATDNVATLYDTDRADTNNSFGIAAELKNTANNELVDPAGMPATIHKGAYVTLAGTNPRALVKLGRCSGYSPGAMRILGSRTAGG